MKKIEKNMVAAIEAKKNMNESNTAVIVNNNGVFVRLYNTIIFALVKGRRYYSDGGWATATTAGRLRALGADYYFYPRDGFGALDGGKLRTQNEMNNLLFFGRLESRCKIA